jgi:Rieske Fe-S protein
MNEAREKEVESDPPSRRAVLAWLGVGASLAAAYGTLAAFMGRFLYPAAPPARGWLYVTETRELEPGGAVVFETPSGAKVNVTRQGGGAGTADFVALGSTCPHLGCQVHWEGQNNRFFCPCHNGIFEPGGKAIGGPPGDAGQSLPKFPVKVEKGLLFMEVPLAELALGPGRVLKGPPAGRGGECRGCQGSPADSAAEGRG